MNSQPSGNSGMNSQPAAGNSSMNSRPAGTSSSMTGTLKGYMNVAMSKGQVAYEQAKILGHKAQGQLSQSKLQAQEAASAKQQSNTHASHPGAIAGAQAAPQIAMGNSQDAFSDLHEFNTQATANTAAYQDQHAQQAAANAASKAAQSTI
ncbi:hypothetical protein BGZ96_003881 [Linnemannia gamsii]|uniref:SMP domain-containing protein n=1 Tax=Linnemannia gamsii TaxID=64522 RepID=A0ABQ7JIU2_9FUNG|nr:hypothetical protein BGZ96_003881 [Linnemannia gamsii]